MAKLPKSFSQELSSPKLLLGLGFIALILVTEFTIRLVEYREQAQEDYSRAFEILKKNSDVGGISQWDERYDNANAHISEIQSTYLWKANSMGEGRAILQKAVDEFVNSSGLRSPQINIGNPSQIKSSPEVWEIQIRVQGRVASAEGLRLIYNFSNSSPYIQVESLDFNNHINNRLSLAGSAFFQVDW